MIYQENLDGLTAHGCQTPRCDHAHATLFLHAQCPAASKESYQRVGVLRRLLAVPQGRRWRKGTVADGLGKVGWNRTAARGRAAGGEAPWSRPPHRRSNVLYMTGSNGLKIVVLETANLEEIKKGRPAKTPDGSVLIAQSLTPPGLSGRADREGRQRRREDREADRRIDEATPATDAALPRHAPGVPEPGGAAMIPPPCANCPWRKDALREHWHPDHFHSIYNCRRRDARKCVLPLRCAGGRQAAPNSTAGAGWR